MARLGRVVAESRAVQYITTHDDYTSTSPSLRTIDALPLRPNGQTPRQSSDEAVHATSLSGPQDEMDEKHDVEDNVGDHNLADGPELVQPETRPSKFFKLFTFCFRGH
ncbi:hypothetical protein ACEPPN_002816 [Leptodophora sp. 'Broadleaf-Isolate-01']